jgi:Mu-like prophage major head subunit gpT
MAGVITTGSHPKALWPGMHKFFGRTYNEFKQEWSDIFDDETSDKNYEEDTEVTGFGLAPVKPQGGGISYDSESQSYTKRYTHVVYGLGYIVTEEEKEDNLYEEVSKKRIKALAFSLRQTEETVCANVMNRAFNSAFTGGDGSALLVLNHSSIAGAQSNLLATAADFSEASLEDICIQIMQATNSRGLKINIMPKKLIVPPGVAFDAERVLKSTQQSGTANNDINAVKSMGLLPDGCCVNHYLTDADAWFIKTNVPDGMRRFTRRATKFMQDNDFDTANAKAKATMRFSVGWTDWRGLYGTPGA